MPIIFQAKNERTGAAGIPPPLPEWLTDEESGADNTIPDANRAMSDADETMSSADGIVSNTDGTLIDIDGTNWILKLVCRL